MCAGWVADKSGSRWIREGVAAISSTCLSHQHPTSQCLLGVPAFSFLLVTTQERTEEDLSIWCLTTHTGGHRIELWDPGFNYAQPLLLQTFGEWTRGWTICLPQSLTVSLPPCLPSNKMKIHTFFKGITLDELFNALKCYVGCLILGIMFKIIITSKKGL